MTISGAARHSGEAAVVVALVVAAARLIVALARLREARQQANAAGASRVAAERMMPLLRHAHAGPGASSAPAGGERSAAAAVVPGRSTATPGVRREASEREQNER